METSIEQTHKKRSPGKSLISSAWRRLKPNRLFLRLEESVEGFEKLGFFSERAVGVEGCARSPVSPEGAAGVSAAFAAIVPGSPAEVGGITASAISSNCLDCVPNMSGLHETRCSGVAHFLGCAALAAAGFQSARLPPPCTPLQRRQTRKYVNSSRGSPRAAWPQSPSNASYKSPV
ncbi:voltage-dependent T-type calcium channel subunit alpha-1G-like protein, putative [Babesia ovata]|uniref:Voltage-dependent T-type calcium channel subunit alpha-1G-like protein, putative n=1 Tax=Babesia ovata TaxID=189622 RepID=A0A2H6KGT2_9APIC|nr:voltage-dependent T-type calcium channel subunit alpha-1G-like protein, putative [Babesia ovata]GBE62196.1 voltage-dependent T-type calcium channel subunit alpha-1G-like protein, putative [Babesia ovata]